ncbi:hypothetical protein H0O02_00760, partial [Candidatus Micrarchaeota archaeon]|nr:hypothetical protein [Candidatus Micrarchaeota archaeon]
MENAIARPWDEGMAWEHGNPHMVDIPGVGVVYDSCTMSRPLADLRLEETSGLGISDANVQAFVNDAYAHSRLYFDSSVAFCANCRIMYISIMSLPFIAIDPGTMNWRFTDMQDIQCMYYAVSLQENRQNWKSAMNNALDALELSMEKADESVNGARSELDVLERAGLCDDDYAWQPHDACTNISEAISIIDSGTYEGTYGKYNILQVYRHNISEAVWEDVPNMALYYPAMEILWAEDGVANTFEALAENGKNAKMEAEGIYRQYESGADAARQYAEEKYDELEENKPEKIDAAVALSSPDASRIGTIAERYETITDEKENADKAYGSAKGMFADEWMQGYLKFATIGVSSSKESYEAIEANIDLLLEDAQQVVDNARSDAEDKINEAASRETTIGSAGKEKLEDARNAFEKGDRAAALGDKYVYYMEAAGLAAAALGEKSFAQESDVQLKIAEIEDLLNRAEGDGINIAGEKAELEMLKNNRELPDIISRLDSLKARIVGKAKIIFGGLEEQREELLQKLRLADADDLIVQMQDAERGIIVNGRVDYGNGLGRLAWLRSEYESIEEQLEGDFEAMNDVVANSIVTDVSLVVGKVRIDGPTDITLNALFKNTNDYAGEDVEVSVPLPGKFQFDYFDITEGAEDVSGLSSGGSELLITLISLGPYETKS